MKVRTVLIILILNLQMKMITTVMKAGGDLIPCQSLIMRAVKNFVSIFWI